jgi:hypothetical protein
MALAHSGADAALVTRAVRWWFLVPTDSPPAALVLTSTMDQHRPQPGGWLRLVRPRYRDVPLVPHSSVTLRCSAVVWLRASGQRSALHQYATAHLLNDQVSRCS